MAPPPEKKQKTESTDAKSSLEQLRAAGTKVVADTGDFEAIDKYHPQDSTTNPSLILAAAKKPAYKKLIDNAVEYGQNHGDTTEEKVCCAMDKLLVEFGSEILKIVPGVVSTEVDARLSFDKERTVKKALRLIELYEEAGHSKDKVLIKIAATWEGIQAARELESKHGIHCNLTLIFAFQQAVACAEGNITLVSPFVGRILDYYKQKTGKTYSVEEHPGILSVKKVYNYYKKYEYKTVIMAASLRTLDEVDALAGLDNMTLSLSLLDDLMNSNQTIARKLDVSKAKAEPLRKVTYIDNEPKFRYELNDNEMATMKLSDGIRKFAADALSLEGILEERLAEE
ncbi:hypothetical protein KAFR_0F03930 [Kazachstania africana CBS 2517]|uniref:Transaldolase n=1 Tax=Kazachstania africana (strain ATCC 22294 / BCRC 22015 / CBS 2517 / CECT 1963 / NBRC 1671 / NRRL Y-8276) TaxID=1071382 RepID=H2AX89_KAZAF|nr:hypothetical protein KAFR_0F03930 [Kazachstania africana CBS 2517]CCF58989.1 hypothetical protein KAFR_0F03930 [Kazachstania africana CBS 2517]